MREWLKWLIAGEELAELHRYRLACQDIYRWNACIEESTKTAEWIMAVGAGKPAPHIEQFRADLLGVPQYEVHRALTERCKAARTKDAKG